MFIDKTQLRNGITQYTYWEELLDSPLGIMWVRIYIGEKGKRIGFLLDVMVTHYYRHKGVCTALANEVLKDINVFIGGSGSNEGGKEFLQKFGFKYNKELDFWKFIKRG